MGLSLNAALRLVFDNDQPQQPTDPGDPIDGTIEELLSDWATPSPPPMPPCRRRDLGEYQSGSRWRRGSTRKSRDWSTRDGCMRLARVILRVADMDRGRFWSETVGLEIVFGSPTFTFMVAGGTQLLLNQVDGSADRGRPSSSSRSTTSRPVPASVGAGCSLRGRAAGHYRRRSDLLAAHFMIPMGIWPADRMGQATISERQTIRPRWGRM